MKCKPFSSLLARHKHYSRRQVIRICNSVILPYLTYGMECITPSAERITKWQKMINSTVNRKGGLPWNANEHLNYLPGEKLGEGLECLMDRAERLGLNGKLRFGLNSVDTDTARLCFDRWRRTGADILPSYSVRGRASLRYLLEIAENRSYLYNQNELKRFFDDATCAALQLCGRNSLSDIIGDEGHTTLETPAHWAMIIGTSSIVNPIILANIGHTKAFGGISHGKEGPLSIWTDASKTENGQVGFAVWFGENHHLNHKHRLPDNTTVFSAEMRAAILALLLHDPERDLNLYSDNKAVIDLLQREEPRLKNQPFETEWLVAAQATLSLRRQRNLRTNFIHVYSHLLDKDRDHLSEEYKNRLQVMKEKLGIHWQDILNGNKMADQQAAAATQIGLPTVIYESPHAPHFLTRYPHHLRIVQDPLSSIKTTRTYYHDQALTEAKYHWRKKANIDWHRSAYLGKDHKRSSIALQRHASKTRRALFADKGTRLRDQEENSNWKLHTYRGVRVKDKFCDLCRKLEPQPVPEDKTHYLFCKAHVERRQQMTTNINERVQRECATPIPVLPCYWNQDERQALGVDDNLQELCTFGPADAAMAIIPRAWSNHLKSLRRNEDSKLDLLIADCQAILVQGFYDCWIKRCKIFHACNRPEPG